MPQTNLSHQVALTKQSVALTANAPFGFSNVGVGLLGQALANRVSITFDGSWTHDRETLADNLP